MRLTDLDPRWLPHVDNPKAVLLFRCPHCQAIWLTCTFVELTFREQAAAIATAVGDVPDLLPSWHGEQREGGRDVVTCKRLAWSRTGETFDDLTVAPSIDASASGHWHGFITNGEAA